VDRRCTFAARDALPAAEKRGLKIDFGPRSGAGRLSFQRFEETMSPVDLHHLWLMPSCARPKSASRTLGARLHRSTASFSTPSTRSAFLAYPLCAAVKPVGEPDAGDRHVRMGSHAFCGARHPTAYRRVLLLQLTAWPVGPLSGGDVISYMIVRRDRSDTNDTKLMAGDIVAVP